MIKLKKTSAALAALALSAGGLAFAVAPAYANTGSTGTVGSPFNGCTKAAKECWWQGDNYVPSIHDQSTSYPKFIQFGGPVSFSPTSTTTGDGIEMCSKTTCKRVPPVFNLNCSLAYVPKEVCQLQINGEAVPVDGMTAFDVADVLYPVKSLTMPSLGSNCSNFRLSTSANPVWEMTTGVSKNGAKDLLITGSTGEVYMHGITAPSGAPHFTGCPDA